MPERAANSRDFRPSAAAAAALLLLLLLSAGPAVALARGRLSSMTSTLT